MPCKTMAYYRIVSHTIQYYNIIMAMPLTVTNTMIMTITTGHCEKKNTGTHGVSEERRHRLQADHRQSQMERLPLSRGMEGSWTFEDLKAKYVQHANECPEVMIGTTTTLPAGGPPFPCPCPCLRVRAGV